MIKNYILEATLMSFSSREKRREYERRYRERNREQLRARTREANTKARAEEPERFREYRRRFQEAHPDYHAHYELARYYRQREAIFNAIGWVCVGCGHDDPRVLEADHKGDDGATERARFKGTRSMLEYYVKRPDEARAKLQALCRNCNWLKRKGHRLPNK
jgi:hypothetical protein